MPSWAEQGGSTWAWRKVRAKVLARDRNRCQLRIAGVCRYKADCVHHLYGKAMGDDPRHLVAACTPCNLHVGDPTRSQGSGRRPASDPPPEKRTAW